MARIVIQRCSIDSCDSQQRRYGRIVHRRLVNCPLTPENLCDYTPEWFLFEFSVYSHFKDADEGMYADSYWHQLDIDTDVYEPVCSPILVSFCQDLQRFPTGIAITFYIDVEITLFSLKRGIKLLFIPSASSVIFGYTPNTWTYIDESNRKWMNISNCIKNFFSFKYWCNRSYER